MPWTIDNPPKPATNWSLSERKRCVSAANAALEDGSSEEDAIFACINAAGRSKKHMEDVEVTIEEEGTVESEEKMIAYSPTAVTFQDLDDAEEALIAAQSITEEVEKFHMLVDNAMWNDEISDKGGHIKKLAGELSARLSNEAEDEQEEETDAKDVGYLRSFVNLLMKALGIQHEDEHDNKTGIMFVKNSDNEWVWFTRYSNKWRDDDNPPEIISEESHKRFVDLVKSKKAPYPELWLWHVNGTQWGKAKWVGYDDQGFALAAGYVYPEFYEVAKKLSDEDVLVSHGMPTTSIKRDASDQSIIIEHETREISPLPPWAAANKMTSFVILKENDMEEFKNKGISDSDRRKLVDELGIPEEAIDRMEAINQKDAKEAAEAGLEFKEGEEEQVANAEPEVETVAEVEETQEATEEIDEEEAPGITLEALAAEIETLAKAVEALNERSNARHDELKSEIDEFKSSQNEAVEQLIHTPPASRAALILQSIVGSEDARIDGRTTLAKDAPKENNEEGSGPHFFQKMGWTS